MVAIDGKRIIRKKNEKIVAISDSVSYKMIREHKRNELTFAFKNIKAKEAMEMINANSDSCIGAVGHEDFAKDLNRLLQLDYHIPYGRGRERTHLTLEEGDYIIIISRIKDRARSSDYRRVYKRMYHPDDVLFTMAKVIKAPETKFEIKTLNEVKVC